ncbi:MAG: helicase C-terminal domain-containing protein, partial [Pseudomonadota bacterium]
AQGERENAIVNVLRYYEAGNALVFCNTRASVNHMVARFNNRGFSVVALSGELSQNERTHALQALRDGRAQVCIATDVAARGIDLPNLELVIHADLPSNPETLLHRSGRTGRAGRKGVSALMVDEKGRGRAERLLRFAKINATWDNPPSANAVLQRDEERILADPLLTETSEGEEVDFAARMLARFSPEQIATGFLRLKRAGRSAPEDIRAVPVAASAKGKFKDRKGAHDRAEPREPHAGKASREFDESLWVTLSVGRKQNAEPRWLIPLMCNAGGLSKPAIGYIRIEQNQTHIELDATKAERFVEAIGPDKTLEKNIRVTILAGKPDFDAHSKPDRTKRGKPYNSGGKRPTKPHRGQGKPGPKVAEKRSSKASAKLESKEGGKPARKTGTTKSTSEARKVRKKNVKPASRKA